MSLCLRIALALAVAALLGLWLQGVCQSPLPVARPPPAATQTATATPTATPTPTLPAYRVTWYGEAFRGGPLWCEEYGRYDPDDASTAASSQAAGFPCGTRLELCSGARCLTVVIKDRCGGCGERHLDVSPAAWRELGRPDYATVRVLAGGVKATAVPDQARSGGERLPLPGGTTVRYDGCAGDGACYWYNFYWGPTHEAVLQPGEGPAKVQHELCHAHQHWSINGGAPLAPSDYDLGSWYSTAEGQGFTATVAGLGWPWTHSAVNGLEDFAWTCAYWYVDPAHLRASSPERYEWARANLP